MDPQSSGSVEESFRVWGALLQKVCHLYLRFSVSYDHFKDLFSSDVLKNLKMLWGGFGKTSGKKIRVWSVHDAQLWAQLPIKDLMQFVYDNFARNIQMSSLLEVIAGF